MGCGSCCAMSYPRPSYTQGRSKAKITKEVIGETTTNYATTWLGAAVHMGFAGKLESMNESYGEAEACSAALSTNDRRDEPHPWENKHILRHADMNSILTNEPPTRTLFKKVISVMPTLANIS